MAVLLSLNVGKPKNVDWHGRTVHTGIWKAPVDGPLMVRRLNVDGDGQGDLNGHGGEQRAVLVYQADSYRYWRAHLGRDDLTFGQFGENFTVDGLADAEVFIGDRYRIGEAEFEVTQPRVTCFRVGMRVGEPRMPALLVAHHRPGFYLRVITEGVLRAGDEIVRVRTGPHELSVAEADALLYLPGRDPDRLRAAVDIAALSPGWQRSYRELLDASAPDQRPGPGPGWPGFRPLRVDEIVAETPAVTSIYLADPDAAPLPPPRPGQYLTLRLAGAADPAPVRSYSLSSDPESGRYRISVKREVHGLVSAYLNTALRPGTLMDVAAPRGDFVLADSDRPVVLLSAGIGVTPVLAMLHRLAARASTREVWWIHTTRDARRQAFAAEAQRLLATLPNAHQRVVYTEAGRLTAATVAALGLPADADAYLCGPERFMTDMRAALIAAGITLDHIRTEMFGALAPINPGITAEAPVAVHPPAGVAGTGPAVTFARSGLTVPWSPARQSLLELAEACDVPTRWSCRSGVCHTCVTPIVSGRLHHDPAPLEDPPAGQALICCAIPDTELVLDL
jgi:ferredoxin-NADP reductase/MOSC domain-containing protein YiiM